MEITEIGFMWEIIRFYELFLELESVYVFLSNYFFDLILQFYNLGL